MKFALFFGFLLSFSFSSDNYINDSNLETDNTELSFTNEMTDFNYHELHDSTNELADCPCCNCYEIYVLCSCVEDFYAQYCPGCPWFPETEEEYAQQLCIQACT